ncbi:MAG: hypothetical protein IJK36_09130 [Bacteroidales bacterium]|nr:hypothetical protein [Bacteroidales bacterium]
MKKIIRTVVFVVVLTSLASCKKEDANAFSAKNNDLEIQNTQSKQEDTRGIDPSGALIALEGLYGDMYDFSNKIKASAVTNDFSTVYMWVIPQTYYDYQWLTILIDNASNVIGLYETEFQTSNNNLDSFKSMNNSESQSFTFFVNDLDTGSWMFYCTASINVYALPDRVQIYNNFSIPTNYSYPWFNNITYGHYNLSNYLSSSVSIPQRADIALRAAATFYNNFYN